MTDLHTQTAEARARVQWCRAWAARPGVTRPQITPEWLNMLDDVDRLAAALEAAEEERDEAKQRAAQNKGVWQEAEEHVVELEVRVTQLEAVLKEIVADGETNRALAALDVHYIARRALAGDTETPT